MSLHTRLAKSRDSLLQPFISSWMFYSWAIQNQANSASTQAFELFSNSILKKRERRKTFWLSPSFPFCTFGHKGPTSLEPEDLDRVSMGADIPLWESHTREGRGGLLLEAEFEKLISLPHPSLPSLLMWQTMALFEPFHGTVHAFALILFTHPSPFQLCFQP